MKKSHNHVETRQEYDSSFPEASGAFKDGNKAKAVVADGEVAEYLSDMLIPMRQLASEAEFKFLTYLLDMAIEEANAKIGDN